MSENNSKPPREADKTGTVDQSLKPKSPIPEFPRVDPEPPPEPTIRGDKWLFTLLRKKILLIGGLAVFALAVGISVYVFAIKSKALRTIPPYTPESETATRSSFTHPTKEEEKVATDGGTEPNKKGADLSYIYVYLYSLSGDFLVEYNGLKTGRDKNGGEFNEISGAQYFKEGRIASPEGFRFGEGDERGTTVFMLPKPPSGTFLISVFSSQSENATLDLRLFNKESAVKAFGDEVLLDSSPRTLQLTFDKNKDKSFATFEWLPSN